MIPNMMQWFQPTLDPQELEKRIGELKTVQFWLEQNSRALGATIQALEVQKLTLNTLKAMNIRPNSQAVQQPAEAAQTESEQNPEPENTEASNATNTSTTDAAALALAQNMEHMSKLGWEMLQQQFQGLVRSASPNDTASTTPNTEQEAAPPAPTAAKKAKPRKPPTA